jgi:zinc/manganese transport system permease protein
MSLYAVLVQPFVEFRFMRRALVASVAVALGSGPIGTLLVLRRMSLMADAMSHAVLPGVALGFLLAGLSLPAMSLGGLLAGLAVALLSGVVTRLTPLREDASFAAFYLISLAAGVMIVSTRGSNVDLLHVLFGSILGIDDAALFLVAGIASATLAALAMFWRPLILDAFDPSFLRARGDRGQAHALFLALVVLNLVAGFQALGTLMAVGLMLLPAAAARFWASEVASLAACSTGIGIASGYAGLLLSWHFNLPSGPAIILVAGAIWFVSVLAGRRDSIRARHLLLAGATLLLPATAGAAERPIPVVASFSILADMAREIGGNHIAVHALVGPDGDAHLFEPAPGDAETLARADLFIVNGLGFEGWSLRLEQAADFRGHEIVASAGIVPLIPAGAATPDPHAWQDVGDGAIYAQNIAAGLAAADPGHAADYAAAGARYAARLAALDAWVRGTIAEIPEAKRRIITTHDAFGYFGRAYGVTFLAPAGTAESSEPSAALVGQLIRLVRDQHIQALFLENMTDPRLLDQLAHDAGVTPAGTLYADALAPPGQAADTYEGMIRHNLTLMTAAMRRN